MTEKDIIELDNLINEVYDTCEEYIEMVEDPDYLLIYTLAALLRKERKEHDEYRKMYAAKK